MKDITARYERYRFMSLVGYVGSRRWAEEINAAYLAMRNRPRRLGDMSVNQLREHLDHTEQLYDTYVQDGCERGLGYAIYLAQKMTSLREQIQLSNRRSKHASD